MKYGNVSRGYGIAFPFLLKCMYNSIGGFVLTMSILEVNGLKKIYTTRFGGSKVEALKNVNFTVEKGELR